MLITWSWMQFWSSWVFSLTTCRDVCTIWAFYYHFNCDMTSQVNGLAYHATLSSAFLVGSSAQREKEMRKEPRAGISWSDTISAPTVLWNLGWFPNSSLFFSVFKLFSGCFKLFSQYFWLRHFSTRKWRCSLFWPGCYCCYISPLNNF